jgi:hypothetical protein
MARPAAWGPCESIGLRLVSARSTRCCFLRSHACGAGAVLWSESVRAAMATRANQIGAGGAGVANELLDALVACLNAGLSPFTRELGSLGTGARRVRRQRADRSGGDRPDRDVRARSRAPRARRFDPIGHMLVIVALTSLTYAIIEGHREGWLYGEILGLFGVCGCSFAGLVFYELRRAEPLLEVRFSRTRSSASAQGS